MLYSKSPRVGCTKHRMAYSSQEGNAYEHKKSNPDQRQRLEDSKA